MVSVSVIIPVYMTEQFLPRCLDSLIAQSYRDFEVILVDDGSPDDCGRICDEYAVRDCRIKAIHQANAGVSAARNRGLAAAVGDFIVFVDSDDWVGPHYLSDLMSANADFVGHAFSVMDEDGIFVKNSLQYNDSMQLNSENIIALLNKGLLGYIFSKRFSRAIIQKFGIHFIEEINHTEDTLFVVDYLQHAKTAEFDDKTNYFYVRYNTRTTLSNNITLERLTMACTANSILCKKLFSADDPRAEQCFYSRISYNYVSYLDKIYLSEGNKKRWKYSIYRFFLKNEDFKRITVYEPNAIWKLSAQSRIIRALIQKNKWKLFLACVYYTLLGK